MESGKSNAGTIRLIQILLIVFHVVLAYMLLKVGDGRLIAKIAAGFILLITVPELLFLQKLIRKGG